MNGIFSRKLLGAWGAMAASVGLLITLAVIQPTLLTEAKEVVIVALAGIFGVGGFQVQQQAKVDTTLSIRNGGA